jgi:hypothetical protein
MQNRLVPMLLLVPFATALAASPDPAPPQAPIHLTPGAVATPEMVKALEEKDRELFDAAFGCKPDTLAPMVAGDFEFIHDKHGMTATSGAQFIASIRDMCEGQKTGRNFRARRELVPGTMTTHALNNFGAMQMGTHRFYALQPGQPDQLTETGRFIHVWKLDDGKWKLARVISYEHVLAQDQAK